MIAVRTDRTDVSMASQLSQYHMYMNSYYPEERIICLSSHPKQFPKSICKWTPRNTARTVSALNKPGLTLSARTIYNNYLVLSHASGGGEHSRDAGIYTYTQHSIWGPPQELPEALEKLRCAFKLPQLTQYCSQMGCSTGHRCLPN